MLFIKNINALRTRKGLTYKEIGEKIGKSYTATRSYFYGGSEPNFETMEKLAKLFKVKTSDLMGKDLTGENLTIESAHSVSEPQETYSKLKPSIPIIPNQASAGTLDNLSESHMFKDLALTTAPSFMGQVDFFIPVYGNSMVDENEKGYPSGSFVSAKLISEKQNINFGMEYIFDTKEGFLLKTLDKIMEDGSYKLTSLNKKYNSLIISEEDINKIAVVTGVYVPN